MFSPEHSLHWLHSRVTSYNADDHIYGNSFRRATLALLEDKAERSLNRKLFLPGHIVGSAWVANLDYSRVVLLHHLKLNKWLQPGGHSDDNPRTDLVALEEAHEELGVLKNALHLVSTDIFDIDIHRYLETNTAKNGFEPEHLHFDIAFLFQLDDAVPIPGNEESRAVRWMNFADAAEHAPVGGSMHRRLRKTQSLA